MLLFNLKNNFRHVLRLSRFNKHHNKHILLRLVRLLLLLTALIIINSQAMVYFDGLSQGDAMWLSLTSITTVGYGDFSATSTEARLVTVVCIYIIGIALLAQIAAEFFEYRINIRELKLKGLWKWKNMNEHILILNAPKEHGESYLNNLIRHIRNTPDLADSPIQILSDRYIDGLPASLLAHSVVHFTGVAENDANLRAVSVEMAQTIIILSEDYTDIKSDSLTFDVISRIKSIGSKARIIAEVTDDSNRQRLLDAGADIVLRPVRAYPEILVRSIAAPGTEAVLENFFTYDGDHIARHDISFQNKNWGEVICKFVNENSGIPLAYIDLDGQVVSNPLTTEIVSGLGIIILLKTEQRISKQTIINSLQS